MWVCVFSLRGTVVVVFARPYILMLSSGGMQISKCWDFTIFSVILTAFLNILEIRMGSTRPGKLIRFRTAKSIVMG